MTKCLISGGCGFIFSNVIIYLLQHTDWDIASVDALYAGSLLNVPHNIKRHKLYIGDICDYHLTETIFDLERPDIVLHGAASSHVDTSILDPRSFVSNNVIGTHSMLEAARKFPPKVFINTSTDEVMGSIDTGHSKETDPMNPRNPYAATKAAADVLGNSYFNTYGLPVITTRSSNVFGGRQAVEKFIPKAITNILAGKKIPLYGSGKQIRSWIYIKDYFWALKKIVECGVPGQAYNIGGVEKENIEVLKLILEIMNAEESFIEHVNDRLGHDIRYSVNDDKLRALGWAPKYQFEEALAKSCGWFQANSWFVKGNKI